MSKRNIQLEKRLTAFCVMLLVVGVIAGYGLRSQQNTSAAPKSRTNGTSGVCLASPNPTLLRSTFTVFLSGMPVNSIVNVNTQDDYGTGWGSVKTDGSGSAQFSDSFTAYSGTSKITVTSSARKSTILATCTVMIQ